MPRRPLPPPDVAVVDPDTGLMARDWYDFFREQFRLGVISLTYGPTIKTDAASGTNFMITPTDNAAFTIAAPTNPVPGQTIVYTIRNAMGAALGVIIWDPVFRLSGGAIVSPANTFQRSISFTYDGSVSKWIERFRSAADVPNS